MTCGHCLRGDTQPMKIKYEYIKDFLRNFEYISSITFTGGEPSLPSGLDGIEATLEVARNWGISIGSFYLATNAKRITDRFVEAVKQWYWYCEPDNEISRVDISADQYHDKFEPGWMWIPEKLETLTWELGREELVGFKNLMNGRVFEPELQRQGRARHFGTRDYTGDTIRWREDVDGEFLIDEGAVYLNCKGNVIMGCDFSYADQDKPENILCRYDEPDLEAIIKEKGEEVD
jgi:hypothetical protein